MSNEEEIKKEIGKISGPFMIIVKGKIFKTNVSLEKDPMTWYSLVGISYVKKIIEKAKNTVDSGTHFVYVIDGYPQVREDNDDLQKRYAYIKMKNLSGKLYPIEFKYLKYNGGSDREK